MMMKAGDGDSLMSIVPPLDETPFCAERRLAPGQSLISSSFG